MDNQTKYEQILIPNLSVTEAISYFDIKYGMYHKGGQMYGDIDKIYICNSNVNNSVIPIPIYVRSAKNNDDSCGLRKMNGVHNYQMIVNAPNVSVLTETDIERVLNSPELGAINLNDMGITIEELRKLFNSSMNKIEKTADDLLTDDDNDEGTAAGAITDDHMDDNMINNNYEVKVDKYKQSIKNALIKADVITLAIGHDDIYQKINTNYTLNELYELVDKYINDRNRKRKQ